MLVSPEIEVRVPTALPRLVLPPPGPDLPPSSTSSCPKVPLSLSCSTFLLPFLIPCTGLQRLAKPTPPRQDLVLLGKGISLCWSSWLPISCKMLYSTFTTGASTRLLSKPKCQSGLHLNATCSLVPCQTLREGKHHVLGLEGSQHLEYLLYSFTGTGSAHIWNVSKLHCLLAESCRTSPFKKLHLLFHLTKFSYAEENFPEPMHPGFRTPIQR